MTDFCHPIEVARSRTHKAREKGSCANDSDRTVPCDCEPTESELADAWAGRARMAQARLDGRAIVQWEDVVVQVEGDDGLVRRDTERRFFIEHDISKILDDTDREALRRAGHEQPR